MLNIVYRLTALFSPHLVSTRESFVCLIINKSTLIRVESQIILICTPLTLPVSLHWVNFKKHFCGLQKHCWNRTPHKYENRKPFQIWHKGNTFKTYVNINAHLFAKANASFSIHSRIRTLPVTQLNTALCRTKYIYTCTTFFSFYINFVILQKLAFCLQLGHVVAHTCQVLKAGQNYFAT